MPLVKKSALVPYSAEAMFRLVNDVGRYPEFLPWCPETQILSESDHQMVASITVAKGPLREVFTTQNTLSHFEHIQLNLLKGPFQSLKGNWDFESLGDSGCRVSLDLQFEFRSAWASALFSPIFHSIANTFVDAFCKRAHALYGGKVG